MNSVAISSDGKRVVSGASDHLVKIWEAGVRAEVRQYPLDEEMDAGGIHLADPSPASVCSDDLDLEESYTNNLESREWEEREQWEEKERLREWEVERQR